MFMEVYYEHYFENFRDKYWEIEQKSIPYMVLIREYDIREKFYNFLESEGFKCVSWNSYYPGVLVNMSFRRFALINRACKYSCIDERNYTLDEFMNEVYNKA